MTKISGNIIALASLFVGCLFESTSIRQEVAAECEMRRGNFRIKIYVDGSHILLKIPITIFSRYRIGEARGRCDGRAVAELISLHPLESNPVGKSWKV